MKRIKLGVRSILTFVIFSTAALVISCSEDSEITFTQKTNVNSEAALDSYFEDAEDLVSTVAITDESQLSGRTSGIGDDRFCGNAKILVLKSNPDNPDTVKIDFQGDGCSFNSVTRKGTITIIYTPGKWRFLNGSYTVIIDMYINGVHIEGTRTVLMKTLDLNSEPKVIEYDITLSGGKITWPDETFATRDAHHVRRHSVYSTPVNNEIRILDGGTANGVNRNGKEYSMEITQDILFKASCRVIKIFMPVAGEKVLAIDGKTITVNYGDGECDRTATITINGESRSVTLERD